MTAPYHVAVYSMYVTVCSNSTVADIIIVVAVPLNCTFDLSLVYATRSSYCENLLYV